MNQANEQELKNAAVQQHFNPIGRDGYSVFLPQDVRTNLAAYKKGDELAGNTLFQNLYQKDQKAALSLVDKGAINHNGMLSAMNNMYGIKENGMVDPSNQAAIQNMMENKKRGKVEMQQPQEQQSGTTVRNNNMPGGQTNSTLAVLYRR
jgi:hypothetical protein